MTKTLARYCRRGPSKKCSIGKQKTSDLCRAIPQRLQVDEKTCFDFDDPYRVMQKRRRCTEKEVTEPEAPKEHVYWLVRGQNAYGEPMYLTTVPNADFDEPYARWVPFRTFAHRFKRRDAAVAWFKRALRFMAPKDKLSLKDLKLVLYRPERVRRNAARDPWRIIRNEELEEMGNDPVARVIFKFVVRHGPVGPVTMQSLKVERREEVIAWLEGAGKIARTKKGWVAIRTVNGAPYEPSRDDIEMGQRYA